MPAREDLATPESWSSPVSTRGAIEAMPAGCIAVVDAMGVQDAGLTFVAWQQPNADNKARYEAWKAAQPPI